MTRKGDYSSGTRQRSTWVARIHDVEREAGPGHMWLRML